jgi:DNA-binding transcriptional LysR family regulator
MDLRLVESFVEAAKRGGFSTAARALRISPAAVSQNIRRLEDQLGTRLFERTTRQVRLTDDGARFLERCAPALESLKEASVFLAEERDSVEGVLRITATTAFGRQHVLPLLPDFLSRYPKVDFDIQLNDGFADLIADRFDLGIRGGTLPENQYISRLLLPLTRLVCAAPSYIAKFGRPRRIADLPAHKLIGMRSNPSQKVFSWAFQQSDGTETSIDIAPQLVVNEPEAASIAAMAGLGIAQIGSNVVLPHIAAGRLELLLPETAVRTGGLYAVWPSRRFTPRKVRAFVDFLIEHFSHNTELVFAPVPRPRRTKRAVES